LSEELIGKVVYETATALPGRGKKRGDPSNEVRGKERGDAGRSPPGPSFPGSLARIRKKKEAHSLSQPEQSQKKDLTPMKKNRSSPNVLDVTQLSKGGNKRLPQVGKKGERSGPQEKKRKGKKGALHLP